jgi:hypothetical protein
VRQVVANDVVADAIRGFVKAGFKPVQSPPKIICSRQDRSLILKVNGCESEYLRRLWIDLNIQGNAPCQKVRFRRRKDGRGRQLVYSILSGRRHFKANDNLIRLSFS